MNEILVKINQILEEGQSTLNAIVKVKQEWDLSYALLMRQKKDLQKERDEVQEMRKVIISIENFGVLKKETETKMSEVQSISLKLKEEKEKFESYKQSEIERISNLRILSQKENDNVVEGFRKLEQDKKNLEAEIDKRVKEFITKHVSR